ncbi:CHAT domain protein [Rhizoctonia solani AG-3 Rhs1AP]|uniref:CHAT domain protein n=1 Tax=Rhizoctonia solani AG-3 Rhs1AP TaxID=1086054 RepID=X8J1X2_9AGAM|nr:CHAT domain protein [Rhizoctonia solani AG-3 Rhs1AP]
MVNEINALNVKIRSSTSPEDFLAVDSDSKHILRQLEPTKACLPGTDGRRELGISIVESFSNVILFNLHLFVRNAEYLDIACYCMDQVLTFIPLDSPNLPSCHLNLAKCLQHRFEVTRVLKDVENSIVHLTATLSQPGPRSVVILSLELLGTAHQCRWTRLFESEDMARALRYFSAALSFAPRGLPIIPTLHIRTSQLYFTWSQFDKGHEVEGLNKAIESQTAAVSLTTGGDARLAGYLHMLGRLYRRRYKRLGKKEDIASAMDALDRSLRLTPHGDPARLDVIRDLGIAYQTRFLYLGDLGDCDHAIQLHEQAVSLAPDGNPSLASYHSSLGDSYMEQFSYSGDQNDLAKAIEHQSRAVSLTTSDDENLPGLLRNLGDSFRGRFTRLHRPDDMKNALLFQTRAVEATFDDDPLKPNYLDSLGSSYQVRFGYESRLHNLNDINKAIEYKTRAVELAPEWHAKRSTFLNNLGLVYQTRFREQKQRADIDQAIEYLSQAVAIVPDGHSDEPNWLNNLGNAYKARFSSHGQLQDFKSAVGALSRAVRLTSQGHVNIPTILNNLANLYHLQFEESGTQEALDSSISYLQQSIDCARNPVQTFDTARLLANLLSSNNRPGAPPIYQIAMNCLPQVIWLGEVASMRIAQTSQLNDFVQEAAAAALRDEERHLALEWLEQGRSIVWGQFLQL